MMPGSANWINRAQSSVKIQEEETNMATKAIKSRTRGALSTRTRKNLSNRKYAFPKERKEPLTDKRHIKNALARFDQVKGVSDSERRKAFERIKKAAAQQGLDIEERSWRDLGKRPHTKNPAHKKKK